MDSADLSIHLKEEETPVVKAKEFRGFFTVDIIVPGNLGISFFVESPQDLVNFKNNFLWALENPTDFR